MKPLHLKSTNRIAGRGERGSLTIFTAVTVLILMTLMLFYTTRVSVLETKSSGNEVRQKEAFQVAEAALEQGITYLLANVAKVHSNRDDVFPDGTAFTGDGWLSSTSPRWAACTSTQVALANHPCGGEIPAPVGAFYYDDPATNTGVDSLPVNQAGFPTGTTARLSALMCFVDLANPGSGTCGSEPTTPEEESAASLVITLLAYGYSDCSNTASPTTCTGQATVALPISNYKKMEGSPAVPLITKSTLPPTGTSEIAGNPNGGGVGVPMSIWANKNDSCPPLSPIASSGSWQTCELQEWYHSIDPPANVVCEAANLNCMCGSGNDTSQFVSWKKAGETNVGIDIVEDANFPCDLFAAYFGVPDSQYHQIKNTAKILPDCSTLGPQSNGVIWISGPSCTINSNTQIGSPDSPVVLITSATTTTFNGGTTVFGVLYIFDGEDSSAVVESTGSIVIYGAVIVDAVIDQLAGTFQVVYNDAVLVRAAGIAGLGSVNGGWRDFGLPAIGW